MRKKINIALVLCFGLSLFATAQENPPKQKGKTKSLTEISYVSQEQKEKSLKEKETRLFININDPSYPRDVLEIEKQILIDSKKAPINNSKK
jgi:hypothetical protein